MLQEHEGRVSSCLSVWVHFSCKFLEQVELPEEVKEFIQESTGNYGKVKLVLHRNKFWVESPFPDVLRTLLKVLLLIRQSYCFHSTAMIV